MYSSIKYHTFTNQKAHSSAYEVTLPSNRNTDEFTVSALPGNGLFSGFSESAADIIIAGGFANFDTNAKQNLQNAGKTIITLGRLESEIPGLKTAKKYLQEAIKLPITIFSDAK